jgi:hypothetical protein
MTTEKEVEMPVQIAAVIRESVRAANEPLVREIRLALEELQASQKATATK